MPQRTLKVETVYFRRREATDSVETGLLVNEGDGPLIDMDGKVVPPPVYDWLKTHEQIMTVTEG